MRSLVAVVAVLTTSCTTTHRRVVTSGQALHDHAQQLRTVGTATVMAQDGDRVLSRYPVRRDQTVIIEGERLTIGELVTECEGASPCALVRLADEPVLLHESTRRTVRWGVFGGVGLLAVTGGLVSWGICNGARCDGAPALNRGTEIAGATSIVIVSGALVYLLVGCLIAKACTN